MRDTAIRARTLSILLGAGALAALACGMSEEVPPNGSDGEEATGVQLSDLQEGRVTTVATGLRIPWEIRFLPGGSLLVTERPGRLVELGPDGSLSASDEVPGVEHAGEGGLMGLALAPDFGESRRIFLCFTTRSGGGLENRVVRYRWSDGELSGGSTVIGGMEAASIHDGCRVEFGPDGLLYVTMGDAGNSARAQDRDALNGKILRVEPDGSAPDGNPYGTRVFSWGHRNPQGLAWDDAGRLWSTEHGPSGLSSGRDELNLIRRGGNYGWPEITGDESADGMRPPLLQSRSDTWAPGDVAHLDGSLFWGGLRGSALYQVRLPAGGGTPSRSELEPIRHFRGDFGRIRVVRVGPRGDLWLATSNRDGRGNPREGDDRIVRVEPTVFPAAGG